MKLKHHAATATFLLLKALKVPVSKGSIIDELEKHPNFPSLFALSEVLFGWKVNNAVYEVAAEGLDEIPTPYIATLKTPGQDFAVVTAVTENGFMVSNFRKKPSLLAKEVFKDGYAGIVLIAEAEPDSGEPDYRTKARKDKLEDAKLPFLIAGIMLILTLCFRQRFLTLPVNSSLQLLMGFKLIGLFFSCVLLIHGLDRHNRFIQRMCNGDGKINCNDVLSSKFAQLFDNLSWSEIGFFYFIGTLSTLFISGNSTPIVHIIFWLNLLSLPYTAYSLYLQVFIIKKWCVMCVTVQIILWLEFLTFFVSQNNNYFFVTITVSDFNKVMAIMATPILIWVFIKPLLIKAKRFNYLDWQVKSNKRNLEYFNYLLSKQAKYSSPDTACCVVLGNPEGKTIVTVVSNLACNYCWTAHQLLERWVNFKEDLQIRIVFNIKNNNAPMLDVSKHIVAFSKANSQPEVKQLLYDWYNSPMMPYARWAHDRPVNMDFYSEDDLKQNINWCNTLNIASTPTILVNGYQLPEEYKIEDIKYLI